MGDTIEPASDEVAKRRAKKLTQQIKTAADGLWALLLEAHEMQAWALLGYSTWTAYVQGEFDMTRRNANRLVAQGEIIAAIEAAMPDDTAGRARPTSPPVSARQATVIQTNPKALPAITRAVKKGVEPATAVHDVVSRTSATAGRARPTDRPEQMRLWPDDPQKAMFASFDAVLDELGPDKTEKLVRTLLKRVMHAADTAPAEEPGPLSVVCEHPKKSELHKGWGVLCGVCKAKLR